MALPNYPNSQNDVISTVTHALLAFEDMVRQEMPECAVVYDEELSYESAIRTLVSKGNFYNENIANLPLFIYNRTPMRKNQWGFGGRADGYDMPLKLEDGRTLIYTPLNGEFDINFIYIAKSVELVEKFEVVYLADEGISNTKEIKVDMADLGVFTYFATYGNEMTDKLVNKEDTYYKGIAGSLQLRGFFFTFRSESKIIYEIRERIFAIRNNGLEIKTANFEENLPYMDTELLAEKLIPEPTEE